MKIAVLVKRVPDTETKVKIAGDGKSLDPAGVNYILNPYDEFAIEEAIQIKERSGGDVVVISAGSKDCTKEMRQALAMGADSGVLLECAGSFGDVAAVAAAFAAKIRELKPDLVLMGKQAVDDDNAALAPYLAELLDWPCASVVVKLTIEGGRAKAEREVEGGRELVEFALPAIVSCQKGLNTPRYASMKGIMMAKKKEITEAATGLEAPRVTLLSMEMPPPRAAGRIVGEGAAAVDALVKALREEAKVI